MKTRVLLAAALILPLQAFPQTGSPASRGAGTCAFKAAALYRASRTQGDFADPGIHVTHYRLRLSYSPSSGVLSGDVAAKIVCAAESISVVSFDLSGTMTVDSVLGPVGIHPHTQFLQGFQVNLGRTYRRGDTLTLDTYYRGVPSPSPTGFGSFEATSGNGAPWFWTLSEPYGARDWWPCKDDNTDKADSVDVLVTVPAGLKAGSNGRLLLTQANANGTTTFHWAERHPIATYLVSITAGAFTEIDDWFVYSPSDSMPIVNYVFPDSGGTGALAETKSMLRIFSEAYGLYPFIDEKYGHAQFGRGGAMEHQTMTSTTNFDETTISHELAHHWFGDLITCANWPSLWLNEGFAVYSESVFLERSAGAYAYRTHMAGYMTPAMSATGTLYVQDTTTVANLFDPRRVYAKGAWTLHMLRHVLGDSVFFRSLRAYVSDPRFRYRSATTEGFRSVCESVSGKNLGYFFDEWVFGEGYPRYLYRWSSVPSAGGYTVTLTLSQTGSSAATRFFRMPVDVRISSGTRDTTVTVDHTATGETFAFSIPFLPSALEIDPGTWILREVTAEDALLPATYALSQNYPNPFNPGTSVTFLLPHRSDVTLIVYDVLGREVAVLAKGQFEAGTHPVRWEGTASNGMRAASGTYFCRFTAGTYTQTRKLVLAR